MMFYKFSLLLKISLYSFLEVLALFFAGKVNNFSGVKYQLSRIHADFSFIVYRCFPLSMKHSLKYCLSFQLLSIHFLCQLHACDLNAMCALSTLIYQGPTAAPCMDIKDVFYKWMSTGGQDNGRRPTLHLLHSFAQEMLRTIYHLPRFQFIPICASAPFSPLQKTKMPVFDRTVCYDSISSSSLMVQIQNTAEIEDQFLSS